MIVPTRISTLLARTRIAALPLPAGMAPLLGSTRTASPRAPGPVAAVVACMLMPIATAAQEQEQPPPCSAPEYRQFDFWIGTWNVSANGRQAGTNTIREAMGGCVLHESYTSVSGYHGESFNIYDAGRDVWHQTWVDTTGLLLRLEGGYLDGEMVLEGETVGTDGTVSQQRITWSLVDGDPDQVRQLWETRTGEGDWAVVFDGLYERTAR